MLEFWINNDKSKVFVSRDEQFITMLTKQELIQIKEFCINNFDEEKSNEKIQIKAPPLIYTTPSNDAPF